MNIRLIAAHVMSLLTLALMCCLSSSLLSQERLTVALRDGWRFKLGEHPDAAGKNFDDADWGQVVVPHDWAIGGPFIPDGDGNTGKLPWKGQGWYRNEFRIPEAYKDHTVYLLFDGVMAYPHVYVNGSLAGKWDYGYSSFFLDITQHLEYDEANTIAVHADTREHDSRWYPGGGLYRKVSLIAVDPLHVDIWGTYVTTPIVKPHYADVRISADLVNNNTDSIEYNIRHLVRNAAGLEVAKLETRGIVAPQSRVRTEVNGTIANPILWDIDDPHLYTVSTEIIADGRVRDALQTRFGVRTFRFTADDGFYLNGRRVQLRGVNLHHDLGPLGAAFNKRAMERQLEIMKTMGVNAIRTSHNIAAPEVLELCDEMGLLVFNEIFDKYDGKADIRDTTDFDDFTHRNMRNFVKRDRNSPSVFLWSVGNEIGDVQWNEDGGFHRLHTMINYLEKYDNTRPNTLVCDSKQSAELRHFDFYDVHCWNYGRRYELARQLEPNKSVIISESASTLSTRGFYEFPLPEEKTDFTRSLQVSSYDLNAPWWAEVADDDFMWQQEESYIAGEFIWTGFDYLGEPTPYNNQWVLDNGMTDREASRSSYFGVVDLCGIPKDRYYLYKSYWKPEDTTIHILPHWNWEGRQGQVTPVFVYTNGDCAELFLNGESQGMRCKDPKSNNSIERFRLMWGDVLYEPGELRVVAYKNGRPLGERYVRTAGNVVSLGLDPDRDTITAGGDDLSFVLIQAYDEEGDPAPLAMDELHIEVTGAGQMVAAGNGNPQSFDAFENDVVSLFYGKAMLIVRSGSEPGVIHVEVTTERLGSFNADIAVRQRE